MYLPGIPSHVVQRGNDRNPCFFEEENYVFFLNCLGNAARRYQVAIHAYVLMTNHVHLLMTPSTEIGISRVMQLLGNQYVQYINKRYRKTGTLWEGRHKSSLIDAERYLLTCYRYIELNPVRANMVAHPGDYPWSSYRHHASGIPSSIISDHEAYLRIAPASVDRMRSYRALFQYSLRDREIQEVRIATTFSMPLGGSRFTEQIEARLGRTIGHARSGRPGIDRDK